MPATEALISNGRPLQNGKGGRGVLRFRATVR